VYKSGVKPDVNNYRPLAITSILCRIMERVIREQIISYLDKKQLIKSYMQHGFMPRKSTVTHLLESTLDWVSELDEGKCVDVIYLDMSKAFDSVVHSKLVYKLRNVGFDGDLLFWLSKFLENRTQCVFLDSYYSDIIPVTCGLPQGSVLVPLLFFFSQRFTFVCEYVDGF